MKLRLTCSGATSSRRRKPPIDFAIELLQARPTFSQRSKYCPPGRLLFAPVIREQVGQQIARAAVSRIARYSSSVCGQGTPRSSVALQIAAALFLAFVGAPFLARLAAVGVLRGDRVRRGDFTGRNGNSSPNDRDRFGAPRQQPLAQQVRRPAVVLVVRFDVVEDRAVAVRAASART